MTIQVVLGWPEVLFAANAGMMRQVQNIKAGRIDRYGGGPQDGWGAHIEGAAGELAVAKALGLYWSGSIGNLEADDVGLLQVRTGAGPNHRLILHPEDPDDRAFVLVTGKLPTLDVQGWIIAKDGKRQEWWPDPTGKRPAYFVPRNALRDPRELTAMHIREAAE